MKSSWKKGLDKNQVAEVESAFAAAGLIRQRLSTLCSDKIDVSAITSRSKENYALASWAYMQADAIGYERALKEIISLLDDKSVE